VSTYEGHGIDYESMDIGTIIGDKVYFNIHDAEEQSPDYLTTYKI
jgi:hypothetical protein